MKEARFLNDNSAHRKRGMLSWGQIVAPVALLMFVGVLVTRFISSDSTALNDRETTTEGKPIRVDVLENDHGLFDGRKRRIVELQRSILAQRFCGRAQLGSAEIRENTVLFDPGDAFECLAAGQTKDIALTYFVEDVPVSCDVSHADDVAVLSAEEAGDVQEALNAVLRAGLSEPLQIDGVMGPKTRRAIGRWQETYGFPPSGKLSNQQYRCLLGQREGAKDRPFEDRDAAQLIITVKGENDPPVAQDDRAVTSENASITANVLNNDSDPDNGDQLRLVELEQRDDPLGRVEFRGNEIVFDPGDDFDSLAAGHTAVVQLNYVVEDGQGAQAYADLTITVQGENDTPRANDDEEITVAGKSIAVDVLSNDRDPDQGDRLRIVDLQQSINPRGSVSIRDNVVSFNPGDDFGYLAAGQTEDVIFTYFVEDVQTPASCEALDVPDQSADWSVEERRRAQEALNDLLRSSLRPPLRLDGVDGPRTRRAIAEWQREHGFTQSGELSSQQRRCLFDQHAQAKRAPSVDRYTAQLIITVRGENDHPVVEDDQEITVETEPIVADVLKNDYDPDDGDGLRIADLTQPIDFQGSAEIRNNAIFYDPGNAFGHLAAGESEDVTLSYVVEDSHGRRTDTQLTITVRGENQVHFGDDPQVEALEAIPAQFGERGLVRPFERSNVPVNYRQGGCGLAASDQVSGVPFCARESRRDRAAEGPGPTEQGAERGAVQATPAAGPAAATAAVRSAAEHGQASEASVGGSAATSRARSSDTSTRGTAASSNARTTDASAGRTTAQSRTRTSEASAGGAVARSRARSSDTSAGGTHATSSARSSERGASSRSSARSSDPGR